MKKGIFLLICILIASSFLGLAVKAEEVQPSKEKNYVYTIDKEYQLEIKVEYGFQGTVKWDGPVKYGRYMPVYVEISNIGKDFSGVAQVMAPNNSNNVTYSQEVKVESGKDVKARFLIPLIDDTGLLQVQLLGDKGNVLLEERYSLRIGNYVKEAYIGVLSDTNMGIDYLDSTDTKVFSLEVSSITDDYRELDLLDVIVINQFHFEALSREQWNVLQEWVVNGGTLAIGTGEYGTDSPIYENITIKATNTEIERLIEGLNVHLDNHRLIQLNLRGRSDLLSQKEISFPQYQPQDVELATRELIQQLKEEELQKGMIEIELEDFFTVQEYNQGPMAQKKYVGKGSILIFPYDLATPKEYITIGRSTLSFILDNVTDYKKRQLDMDYYGGGGIYDVASRVAHEYIEKTPQMMWYAGILGLYLLALSVSFFYLRKKDKKTRFWIVAPCLAVFFTFIIYIVGSNTRIDKPYASYLELVTFDDSDIIRDEIYFSLTSPYNKAFSTSVDHQYKVTELKDAGYNYEMDILHPKHERSIYQYKTNIKEKEDSIDIQIKGMPGFASSYYQAKNTYREESKLKAEIEYYGEEVEGTITNGFDYEIENAILMVDGYMANLGTMEQGEEVTVSEQENHFFMAPYEMYDSEFITRALGGNPLEDTKTRIVKKRAQVMEYFLQNGGLKEGENYLIGFVQKDNSFIDTLKEQMDVHGLQVILVPIAVDYIKDNKIFVPSLDPYKKQGAQISYNSSRYLYEDDQIIEYALPKGEKVLSFEWIANRNRESTVDFLRSFKGNIYFYNTKLEEYEKVFDNTSSVTNGEDYISEDGILTVKYELDLSIRGEWIIAPHISYWKEGISATD